MARRTGIPACPGVRSAHVQRRQQAAALQGVMRQLQCFTANLEVFRPAVQSVEEATHSMDCVQLAAAIIPRGARRSDTDWLSVARAAPATPRITRPVERNRATAPSPSRRSQTVVKRLLDLVISQCAPRTCKGGSKLPQSKVSCACLNVFCLPQWFTASIGIQ